jgi:hypothetical protein
MGKHKLNVIEKYRGTQLQLKMELVVEGLEW